MRLILVGVLFLVGYVAADEVLNCTNRNGEDEKQLNCKSGTVDFQCQEKTPYPEEVCVDRNCAQAIIDHIKEEFNAAFTYMYYAVYFAQSEIYRPGLAKFLFEAASEERGHAIHMMDYLNTRGIKLTFTELYKFDIDADNNESFKTWKAATTDATEAYKATLKSAVDMEIYVTEKIRNVIDKCSDDYHAADVFTNPILEEQHVGLRKLQGAMQYFDNLRLGSSDAAYKRMTEYVFDQKLLSGEI